MASSSGAGLSLASPECHSKLISLRIYVPFLNRMIDKLEDSAEDGGGDSGQLSKMKSLRALLTAPPRKLRMDTLEKCEQVLQRLHHKVEGRDIYDPKSGASQRRRTENTPRSPSPEGQRQHSRERSQEQGQTRDTLGDHRREDRDHRDLSGDHRDQRDQRGPWGDHQRGPRDNRGWRDQRDQQSRPNPWQNDESTDVQQAPWGWDNQRQPQGPPSMQQQRPGPWQDQQGPPGPGPLLPQGPNPNFGMGPRFLNNNGAGLLGAAPPGMPPAGPMGPRSGFNQGPRFGGPTENNYHGFNNPRFPGNFNGPRQANNSFGGGGRPPFFDNNEPRFNDFPNQSQQHFHDDNRGNQFQGQGPQSGSFFNEPFNNPFQGPNQQPQQQQFHQGPGNHDRFQPNEQQQQGGGGGFFSQHNRGTSPQFNNNRHSQDRDRPQDRPRDRRCGRSSPPKDSQNEGGRHRERRGGRGRSRGRDERRRSRDRSRDRRRDLNTDRDRSRDQSREWSRDRDRRTRREDPRRRPIADTPASPPKQSTLDTPASPALDTPASPPAILDTPASPAPELDTPASPTLDTPASPPPMETPASPPVDLDTPASPGRHHTPLSPPKQVASVLGQPKVIPLERKQTARAMSDAAKKAEIIRKREESIISNPITHLLTAKRPEPRRSPAASLESPASPPSSASSSPSVSTPTPPPSIPVMPVSNKQMPSARSTPRPSLPPITLPTLQQPVQPPRPRMLRPMGMPPRPPSATHHHFQGQFRPQPDPRNSPFQPRKPLTYGEYRKLKQEQERHYMRMMEAAQKAAEDSEKVVHQFGASDEKTPTEATLAEASSSMAKFKIPKKKRPSVDGATAAAEFAQPLGQKSAVVSSRKESESTDSEPELKIAEDGEVSEHETSIEVQEEEEEEKVESDSKSEENKDLESTKQMVKKIAASLDDAAAAKLLKRANAMEKEGKLSMKQIKVLLTYDSSSEDEVEEPKKEIVGSQTATETKGKARRDPRKTPESKKVKTKTTSPPTPTPGTRRSRRLLISEESKPEVKQEEKAETSEDDDEPRLAIADDAVNNDDDDDDEDEEDQLVIDEHHEGEKQDVKVEAVKVEEVLEVTKKGAIPKKARGRPKKQAQKGTSPPVVEVKLATAEEDIADLTGINDPETVTAATEPEEVPQSRTRSGRMAKKTPSPPKKPKSKTWFLQSRGATKTRKSALLNEAHPSSPKPVTIKTEPKDVDKKVFIGSDNITFQLPDEYDPKKAVQSDDPCQSTGVRARLRNLTGIFSKMEKLTSDGGKAEADEVDKEPELRKEVEAEAREPEVEPVIIITEEPSVYKAKMATTISRLQEEIETIPDESEEIKLRQQPDKQSFRRLVQTLAKDHRNKTPTVAEQDAWKMSPLEFNLLSKTASLSPSAKDVHAVAIQLSEENRSHLFKCAAVMCSFTTERATSFLDHLQAEHVAEAPLGWLHCVYCNKAVISPRKLTGHVIVEHGKCSYQCHYCYHRVGSALTLQMHQQVCHPGKETGFVKCQVLSDSEDETAEEKLNHMIKCHHCSYISTETDLSRHLRSHPGVQEQTDFACGLCSCSFRDLPAFACHQTSEHSGQRLQCRQTVTKVSTDEVHDDDDEVMDVSSSDLESDCEDCQAEEEISSPSDDEGKKRDGSNFEDGLRVGLCGQQLYRCGNTRCGFSAPDPFSFRSHLAYCPYSINQVSIECYHCKRQLKHVATLMDHLKMHGLKRYSCSLCQFTATVSGTVKGHLKADHKVTATKMIPADPTKNDPELDMFVLMPKNSLVQNVAATVKDRKSGNHPTHFSPDTMGSIPKQSMFRLPLGCTQCDFTTKVRNNLLKHLRLHARQVLVEVPPLTPINPPTEAGDATRMSILLEADTEEQLSRKPMTADDLAQMPNLVPENLRYACCDADCTYCTIDDVMLMYHIQAIHPDLTSYECPHCLPGVLIGFDDLSFHMRCHGDKLYKCGHCLYFHWQKRVAEKHVQDKHPQRKQYVRDVRKEAELIMQGEGEVESKQVPKPEPGPSSEPFSYKPFKCSMCDASGETSDAIRQHCGQVHDVKKQFKCGLCNFETDIRTDVELHSKAEHDGKTCVLKVFHIDATSGTDSTLEERRHPLWSRNMPGLKHIRGILYDEEMKHVPTKGRPAKAAAMAAVVEQATAPDSTVVPNAPVAASSKGKSICDEADDLPMSCKECGTEKKSIKGLKLHIKLMHLRTGKFRCKRCQFSANILPSLHTHYKIAHADVEGSPEYEERAGDAEGDTMKSFTNEFWKENWGIPTLVERKAMVKEGRMPKQLLSTGGKRKAVEEKEGPSPKKKKGKKKGGAKGRKGVAAIQLVQVPEAPADVLTVVAPNATNHVSDMSNAANVLKRAKEKIMEISPFDGVPTYKCLSCPKRSQNLERIHRHISVEHPCKTVDDGFKILSRDAIVDMLTLQLIGGEGAFGCFYCDDVSGDIHALQDHFKVAHPEEPLKVKSGRGGFVGGYLECQVCGHLTSGFEKSKQTIHFHEEHPLEPTVNSSKYVLKTTKAAMAAAAASDTIAQKHDLSRFNGTEMRCPREGCGFSALALSTINTHMRKHTQTFKCGHCGRTHHTSAEFHQHSAMSHGDKIPDQVKDPEAEAELEALRALFEASLLAGQHHDSEEPAEKPKRSNVARKSTGGSRSLGSKKKPSNVARKSTGMAARVFNISYYGRPFVPIDLDRISTKMSMSGFQMEISAKKMSGLVNLKPVVKVEDCEK